MRIAAVNPYLETRGGGEKYFLAAASALARRHSVDVLVPRRARLEPNFAKDLGEFLDVETKLLNFVPASSLALRLYPRMALHGYDGTLSVSNGLPPSGVPRPHICILQFPWGIAQWSRGQRRAALRTLLRTDRVIVYSDYVRDWLLQVPYAAATVVNPGVRPIGCSCSPRRSNTILSVGRLTDGGHNKNHRRLIEAFAVLSASLDASWRLVLAGAAGANDRQYVDQLVTAASGLPVEVHPNLSRAALESLYCSSRLYWHATGLGSNDGERPEMMEHFGITVVEAMSAGCVPLVYGVGGPASIVQDGVSGATWRSLTELCAISQQVVQDPSREEALRRGAISRAGDFSPDAFIAKFTSALPFNVLT